MKEKCHDQAEDTLRVRSRLQTHQFTETIMAFIRVLTLNLALLAASSSAPEALPNCRLN